MSDTAVMARPVPALRAEAAGAKPAVAADAASEPADAGQATPVAGSEAVFRVRVADAAGVELHTNPDQAAVPSDKQARQLVFDVQIAKGGQSPTSSDMALYREISRVEHALVELYPADQPDAESRFRPFFVRLFHIAQLSLEGDVKVDPTGTIIAVGGRLSLDAAKAEIQAIADELVEDEAPRIKSQHLRELARWATIASAPALAAYLLISLLVPDAAIRNGLSEVLHRVHVDPLASANFMLLWTGTMVGVCLSYAFRTTQFSLADLTRSPDDNLSPLQRLLFTGALATILVLMATVNLGDVTVGQMSISRVAEVPMLAFVVGAILGIGEQTLARNVATRAGQLFGDSK